jgi:MFS superfamily sulfate permease-like transporter
MHFLNVVYIYMYNTIKMSNQLLNSVADTLTKKPEYGIVSSMLSITMSTTEVLQLVGVIIGLFIAVITAILKIMELKDKLRERRKAKRLKKMIEDAREEEE